MSRRISHDRLFKQLFSTFFEDFMTLFFPDAARHIDFSHLSFLRQELFTDVARGDVRYVDLLVETKLKGEDGVIVVHVETQASRQRDFHERMFVYFARLYEKLRKRIVPVAVFAYRRGEDEPDGFELALPFLLAGVCGAGESGGGAACEDGVWGRRTGAGAACVFADVGAAEGG